MFGKSPLRHTVRALRAIATNQVARLSPGMYVSLTGETGRGRDAASAQDVAGYFRTCFDDYAAKLGMSPEAFSIWLRDKRILEYGPGDVPAMGLLLLAHGARSVVCVDRFPLIRLSPENRAIIAAVLAGLDGELLQRAQAAFSIPGNIDSGFAPDRLRYAVRPNGLSGERGTADLIISRAVLEHVNDLPATFKDMSDALAPGGIAIHQVDLKSHGLHEANPLDFLTWPAWLWHFMYSHKGVPNRERPGAYRHAIAGTGLEILEMTPTALYPGEVVTAVQPHLPNRFRTERNDDLAWQGFWLRLRRRSDA